MVSMAKRLGPKPPVEVAPVKPTQYVAARTKGLQLIATLQPISIERIVSIDSPEGFLAMDAKLASIRNARAQWKLALEPIAGPLERAIAKQKEALAEAKKASEGVKQLESEVGDRLDRLERKAKDLMADYKTREQQRIANEKREKDRKAQQLIEEARKREIQAASARTPQLKARLEQQRADLITQAQEVEDASEEITPVKGASSTTRTQQKVRIVDPMKFLAAVKLYEPTAGVYDMGVPPLMVTDRNGEPTPLVEIVAARLNDLYREQPGVVASWPGVEIYDDITIAGR
jgi:hypothetical protein